MKETAIGLTCVCEHSAGVHEPIDMVPMGDGWGVVVGGCRVPTCDCDIYEPKNGSPSEDDRG